MSRKTKITALPALPPNVDPQLKPILHAIKEALEVQVGHRGERLDKAVTFRDLTESGMAGIRFDSVGEGQLLPITNPGDRSTPPVPHTLAANGTFTNVIMSWGGGFRHPLVAATEVFRNTTDNLLTASFIGATPAHIYVDVVEPGTTHYYWVRFRSPAGVLSAFNATDGTSATTSIKVSDLLTDLNDAIGQTHLSTALSTEIDAIAINGTSISTEVTNRIAAIAGEAATRLADINAEILARTTGDGTLQGNIDTVSATVTTQGTNITGTANAVGALVIRVTDNEGDISTNATDITALETTVNDSTTGVAATASGLSTLETTVSTQGTATTTNATDITALETTVNDSTTGVAATASGLSTLETTVSTQGTATTTNATDITALETTVNHGTTGVAASASGLSTLETTVTSQGTAITSSASDITTLNTTVAGNSSSILSHAGSINGISAEQYVKLDVNGNVAGYGIYNSASGSEFAVNANVFKIANGASRVVPFSVVGGTTYINTAMIADASIDVAKISNLTVDMAQVTGTLTTSHVDALFVTSNMVSAAGISADKITMDGNIEFANNNSGVQFGKTSLGDTQAGAFFGRSGGVAGFNISSATSGIYADSTGQVALNNVRLYSGVAGVPFEYQNPGTYTRNISSLTTSISVIIIGGGGGACNNATSGTSTGNTYKRAGTSGTASYIKWYSGQNGTGTLLGTYTGTGGAGVAAGSVGSNTSSASGTTGQASSKAAGGSAGTYGYNYSGALPGNGSFGSGGGGAANGSTSSGTPNAPVNQTAGAGGTISQLLYKPSGAQSIKMYVGTGGTGGAAFPAAIIYAGGNGGDGFVSYADPNSGGIEIDLTEILNRLSALDGQ